MVNGQTHIIPEEDFKEVFVIVAEDEGAHVDMKPRKDIKLDYVTKNPESYLFSHRLDDVKSPYKSGCELNMHVKGIYTLEDYYTYIE